jgi:AI-2 transport protein TqsA
MTEDKLHPLSRFLFIAAAIVFIVWGISQAQSGLVSFLVSVFLAVLATPPVLWLERKRMPVVMSVMIVVIGIVFCLLAIGAALGTSVNRFSAALPQYQSQIHEQVLKFKQFLASKNITSSEKIPLEYINPGVVMDLTSALFMRLGSVFSNLVLIVITTMFILLEASSFPVKLRAVLGDPHQVFPRFIQFVADMKRYMVIKTLISLATGILIALWMSILGVDFPILWGFLAFLLNYVPSLGSTVAAIPAVFLALIQLGIWKASLAAVGYIIVNLVLDYGIEKRIMGRELGLSTLVVFLSLIFWASLLGPIGAVLCIPLTMALKFSFESSESTRWVAVLLGPEIPIEHIPPAR